MTTNANSSTTNQWLKRAVEILSRENIATARLDSLVLLEDFTGKDRSWLLANPDFKLQDTSLLNKLIERRATHEPLAYIRGKSEFYGREFLVNEHTLEPRPETETMIDHLKSIVGTDEQVVIVDVGTGSGCIAITSKLELPNAEVWAIDIDQKCLDTAAQNAKNLKAAVNFCKANLLEDYAAGMTDKNKRAVICTNLPYVPSKYELNEAAKFEPKHAIFGGEDGLDLYRQLFAQIADGKKSRYSSKFEYPKYVLTESLPFQHLELARIAKGAGYKLEKTDDFIQVFRFAEQPLM